ncbi:MAG: D-2-hydroxyacid dehydrogenase [Lachnospiraceae bacterium]|nr:D-2-hydroxyacid dehydrogenase [Lachnospiraceae bacterium]
MAKFDECAGCGRVFYVPQEDLTEELVAEASVIIGWAAPSMIRASEKLELLQLFSAGADAFVAPGILSENTVLCNATGAYGKAVAEHAFALTLMLMKKLYLYRDAQVTGSWTDFGPVTSPGGATVLIAGLGDIGLYYARLMKSMGAYVIGVKRRQYEKPEEVDELVLTGEIDKVLPRADIIMSVLPGTDETRHFYTKERFSLMKKSALFINCGRGNAVESEVLLSALRNGEIAAAAIDVAEQEPLPAESPLWSQENLIITPHVAGSYHLPDIMEGIVGIACENLRHWAGDRQYRNVVDKKSGYKK